MGRQGDRIDKGMWWARSAKFMQQPYLQNLRWMRVFGDTIFAAGIVMLAIYVFRVRVNNDKSSEIVPASVPNDATEPADVVHN